MNDDTVDATLRERFSRQADALPGPDLADVRHRARQHGVPPRRRRQWQPSHLRWAVAVVVALLAGSGFGFALGTSDTPAGTAASGPVELGFLPARGWNVLQQAAKARARTARQAIAANVPLRPEDDADGIPYATLLGLPSNGVVVVASFTPDGGASSGEGKLPLRLRDARPHSDYNAQLRPTNPLGQYRLRADVDGYGVDVDVYFGTRRPAAAVITAAQRQLDRLVVQSVGASNPVEERALPMRPAGTSRVEVAGQTSRIVDRTFRCTPFALGDGLRDLNAIAWPLDSKEFQNPNPSPGYVGVSSGGFSPTSDLISVRAAAWQRFRNRPRIPEGVYVHARRCSLARVSIPLSPRGLPGPPVQFGDDASCATGGRVLIRVRAVLQSAAPWQRIDRTYAGARRNVVEAAVAVRSESRRRPLAFIELGPGGKTRLWVSSGCT